MKNRTLYRNNKQRKQAIHISYIKPLKIATLGTRHNLVLAPLAGISNYPFRQLSREFGADLTFSEMVSVDGLLHGSAATWKLLTRGADETPFGFQLFGSNPDVFEKVLPQIEEKSPDVIDLNFGCPVQKVVRRGAGAALLKDLKRMEHIVRVIKQGKTPVTAKIRIGWDWENIVVEEAAQVVEAAGADALIVHGRTRSQGYSGKANWEYIARAKAAVRIPVIGNGDIFCPQDALQMFRQTGVDGIMIARGAMGRPWIFNEMLHFFETGETPEEPGIRQRIGIMKLHYQMAVESFGEALALQQMKKHFAWYTHGLPHTAKLRDRIFRAKTYPEIKMIFGDYREQFEKKNIKAEPIGLEFA